MAKQSMDDLLNDSLHVATIKNNLPSAAHIQYISLLSVDAFQPQKSSMQRLTVAYMGILLCAKIYNASHMFISIIIPTCQAVIRNLI